MSLYRSEFKGLVEIEADTLEEALEKSGEFFEDKVEQFAECVMTKPVEAKE